MSKTKEIQRLIRAKGFYLKDVDGIFCQPAGEVDEAAIGKVGVGGVVVPVQVIDTGQVLAPVEEGQGLLPGVRGHID